MGAPAAGSYVCETDTTLLDAAGWRTRSGHVRYAEAGRVPYLWRPNRVEEFVRARRTIVWGESVKSGGHW